MVKYFIIAQFYRERPHRIRRSAAFYGLQASEIQKNPLDHS